MAVWHCGESEPEMTICGNSLVCGMEFALSESSRCGCVDAILALIVSGDVGWLEEL